MKTTVKSTAAEARRSAAGRMSPTQRRERLRAVLAGDECVYAAPVHDPISACIAEDLGFEVGFIANRVIPAAMLCAPPETDLLTLSEIAQHVRNICRASDISLVVQAYNGFGHALNVMRAVEELESVGVSGLFIHDAGVPLKFGNRTIPSTQIAKTTGAEIPPPDDRDLVPLDEMVGKIKAAVAARQDPSLVIGVKTFGFIDPSLGGAPEVVRRIKAYEQAGVDALHIFPLGVRELEAVRGVTTLPLVKGFGNRGQIEDEGQGTLGSQKEDRKFLASKGVRLVNPGHFTIWAAAKASYEVLKGLRDGRSIAELRADHYSPELEDRVVIRSGRYDDWVKSFMN